MAAGLVAVAVRDSEGRPCLDVDAGETDFVLVQPAVGIVLGNSTSAQIGTLFITTSQHDLVLGIVREEEFLRLIWLSDENSDKGYAVDFLSLSMHAISRDPAAFPQPCIYTQIESDGMVEDDEEEGEAQAVEGPASTDLSKVQEMRLVPQDPAVLDHVFQVLCDCALLNPDPEGEQEGEGEWFFNADEVIPNVIGGNNGHHDISSLVIDDSRYEDAEDESIEDEES